MGATPEQVEHLDSTIKLTPFYEELKQTEAEVLSDLDGLKHGQETLSSDLDDVKTTVDGMGKEMKEVKDMVQAGFRDLTKTMADHIEQSKNNKIDELTKKLDGRDYVKNGIIITLVGGIVLYVVIGGLKLSLGVQ